MLLHRELLNHAQREMRNAAGRVRHETYKRVVACSEIKAECAATICGDCLEKKTCCANCGRDVEVEESVAIPNFSAARVDLFCDSCYDEMD